MTKAKQSGATARKYTCAKCRVLRWTEQFRGLSVSKLNQSSVCDLCTLEAGYKKALEELEARHRSEVANLLKELREVKKEVEGLRNGEQPSELSTPEIAPNEKERKKKKKKKKKKNRKEVGKIEEKEKKVEKKKKDEKEKSRKKKSKTLVEEKVEIRLFGDSIVRGLTGPLTGPKRRTVVTSLPGKGNSHIRKEVEKAPLTKDDLAVIAVSGNDLYTKSGRVGKSEKIIADVMGAVDDCRLKTKRTVVVGMLPRRGFSGEAYSKNIGTNNRLRDLCFREGVLFADPYSEFYGRGDLYAKDGVHLNVKGRGKLISFIRDACDRTIRLTSEVSPSRSFASVARVQGSIPHSGNGRR